MGRDFSRARARPTARSRPTFFRVCEKAPRAVRVITRTVAAPLTAARTRAARAVCCLIVGVAGCDRPADRRAAPPIDAELFGYEQRVVDGGDGLAVVLGAELVVRVPRSAEPLSLQIARGDAGLDLTVAREEERGRYRLMRVELESAPAGDRLEVRDAEGRVRASFRLADPAPLPEELRARLESASDERRQALLEGALERLSPRARVAARVELARVAQSQGDVSAAIAAWDRVAEAATSAGVPTEASRGLRAAAHQALYARRFDDALRRLDRAEALDRETRNAQGIARALRTRAYVLLERGSLRRAEAALDEAEQIAWASGLDVEAALATQARAPLLARTGQHAEAVEALDRVAPRLEGTPLWMHFVNDRGWVLLQAMEAGAIEVDRARPRAAFEEARRLAQQQGSTRHEANHVANLVWVEYLDGRHERALTLLRELERLDPARESFAGPFTEVVAGQIALASGALTAAEMRFDSALRLAEQEGGGVGSEYAWRARFGRAQVRAQRGRFDRATDDALAAIDEVESLATHVDLEGSRALFRRDRRRLYESAARWALEAGREGDAFLVVQRLHTMPQRELETRLRLEALPASRRERLDALVSDYLDARARYEVSRSERDLVPTSELPAFDAQRVVERRALASRFNDIEGYLERVAPISIEVASPDAVAEALEPDEALLSLSQVGDRVLGFVIRPETRIHRWLARAALAPFADDLAGVTSLYVVAAAEGARALHRAQDPSGAPWLERFGIAYLTHAGVPRRAPAPGPRVVVADPDGDLPHARAEGARVAELTEARVVVGDAATRRAVLDLVDGSSLFHFAGHGRLRGEGAWDAHLDLTGGQVLSLEDLLVAAPRVGVVVLSGCRTAETATAPISLAEAFVALGASGVLATDGDVDDAAAQRFIESFYAHGGAREPVRAYRDAALSAEAAGASGWRRFRVLGWRRPEPAR